MRISLLLRTAICAGLIMAPPATYAGAVDGHRIVSEALASAGRAGEPEISTHRPLPECVAAPSVTPKDGWSRVVVTCADPAWTRHVRINQSSATIDAQEQHVLVLAESLSAGTVLTKDHLKVLPARGTEAATALTDPEFAVGRELKRALGAGHVLQARHLEMSYAVRKGDTVTVIVDTGALQISSLAEALQDGQIGEKIALQSLSSGKHLNAVLTGPAIATIRAKKF